MLPLTLRPPANKIFVEDTRSERSDERRYRIPCSLVERERDGDFNATGDPARGFTTERERRSLRIRFFFWEGKNVRRLRN